MKSRAASLAVALAALALGGAALNRLAAPAWEEMRAREPALKLDATFPAAGQGVTLALLGGFRALVADGTWLRMYDLWEKRDLPGVQTLIRLVTTIDPRPVYFWVNGARILAHDFPAWRIEAAGGHETAASGAQGRIDAEQGRMALALIAEAMVHHPASADLWIERASIELLRLRDVAAAAESYRRASEQPRAPFYAARLHAELLRRLGRRREALDWLTRLHPTLPAGNESAAGDVVLARIRELERELRIGGEQAYRPPSASR